MKRVVILGLFCGLLLGCATGNLTPEEKAARSQAYWESVERTKQTLFTPMPTYRTRTVIIYRVR